MYFSKTIFLSCRVRLITQLLLWVWKVWIPLTGSTTPVGWLSLLQLIVITRSAIAVWRFCVFSCFFDFSVDVGAFVIGLSQISSFFFSYPRLLLLLQNRWMDFVFDWTHWNSHSVLQVLFFLVKSVGMQMMWALESQSEICYRSFLLQSFSYLIAKATDHSNDVKAGLSSFQPPPYFSNIKSISLHHSHWMN